MINASDRGEAMKLIDEAVCSGVPRVGGRGANAAALAFKPDRRPRWGGTFGAGQQAE